MATTVSPGAACNSRSTSCATPLITCSQLSNTSTAVRDSRYSTNRSSIVWPCAARTPSAAATCSPIAPSERTNPRSTNHTPSADPTTRRCPASITSLVLPIPPTLTTVTSLHRSIISDSRDSSAVRPTNASNTTGRLPTTTVDVRSAGNTSPPTCQIRTRRIETGELVLPEIVEHRLASQQRRRRVRQQDLTAVPGRHDPRRPVQRTTEVVAVTLLSDSRVQTHPHRHSHTALSPQRGMQRTYRIGERRREPVTARREDVAVKGVDRRAQHRVVNCELHPHRRRIVLPPARRALDVGEQERHRPRRNRCHHRILTRTTVHEIGRTMLPERRRRTPTRKARLDRWDPRVSCAPSVREAHR